ncbi:MAG TPA: cation transporter dimerization domain-containing protein, partial [Methanomassiliicoccales archaeon]|nr:cation transporter dimerization domain-containing protein [Methanomassiliicoccales archaeon]
YHDLKTRRVGYNVYAEMHVCVPAQTTMAEAHDLTESLEKALLQKIPGIVVSIHMETEKECLLPSQP